jgi:hypothetical protein
MYNTPTNSDHLINWKNIYFQQSESYKKTEGTSFKAKVAIEALKDQHTLSQLAVKLIYVPIRYINESKSS